MHLHIRNGAKRLKRRGGRGTKKKKEERKGVHPSGGLPFFSFSFFLWR